MAYIRFVLIAAWVCFAFAYGSAATARDSTPCGQFCPDDPIAAEPPPLAVGKLEKAKLDPAYDQIRNVFGRQPTSLDKDATLHSQNINSIDEVPDSDWYTNRFRANVQDLANGPQNNHAPSFTKPLTVLSVKAEGATPGLVVKDNLGQRFVLKLDAAGHPRLESGADVFGSKLFYALGYHVPENYSVAFRPEQLAVNDKSTYTDLKGDKHPLDRSRLIAMLRSSATLPDGRHTAIASYFIAGKLLGPWSYSATRSDDPNDLVSHQNRRELRALRVFGAWVNHADATDLNTLNSVQTIDGIPRIRHYLIDFGSIMGSSATGERPPYLGYETEIDFGQMWRQTATLGLLSPAWQKAVYPRLDSVGRFESDKFDPFSWVPIYRNPAFELCQPEDAFWAIRKMMSFSPRDLRVLVASSGYDSPEAIDRIVDVLLERRSKIVHAWVQRELFLGGFRIEHGRLAYDDLGREWDSLERASVHSAWFLFDNATGQRKPLSASGLTVPSIANNHADATASQRQMLQLDLSSRTLHRLVRVTLASSEGPKNWRVIGVARLADSEASL